MVPSTVSDPITITPNAVRYDLTVDRLGGTHSGQLRLQRAHRTEAGQWTDDPRPGARKSVELPASCFAAVDGLIALLPTVIGRVMPLTLADIGDVRLRLSSRVDHQGLLDVSIVLQVAIGGGQWIARSLPSLNELLGEHQDLIEPVTLAWDTLDDAVAAINNVEEWV